MLGTEMLGNGMLGNGMLGNGMLGNGIGKSTTLAGPYDGDFVLFA